MRYCDGCQLPSRLSDVLVFDPSSSSYGSLLSFFLFLLLHIFFYSHDDNNRDHKIKERIMHLITYS